MINSARATAIDQASRAGKAQAQAQVQQLPTQQEEEHSVISATITSVVRGIARGLSAVHLAAYLDQGRRPLCSQVSVPVQPRLLMLPRLWMVLDLRPRVLPDD